MNETPNYIKAEADYIGGMKYKDIAEKYAVTLATVKSWKTRHRWSRDKKGMHTKSEKVCIQNKKDAEVVAEEVESVISNHKLTDRQRLFCCIYIKCFNATKAYQKAYQCEYTTAAAIGYRLLANVGVKTEIQRLKQDRLNREFLDQSDIFQKYMDIAFSDITDYVEFGREEVAVMGPFGPIETKNEKTGEKTAVTKVINAVRFKEHTDVDGTLITEVKQGKDGASIKLADRMKALDWLTAHMNIATDKQKAELEVLRSKVKADKDTPIQITFTKASEKNEKD